MKDIKLAAEEFFLQNEEVSHPLNPEGIIGTSIGFGEQGIGIIIHIKSSQEVYDVVPSTFKNFKVYKRFESNKDEIK